MLTVSWSRNNTNGTKSHVSLTQGYGSVIRNSLPRIGDILLPIIIVLRSKYRLIVIMAVTKPIKESGTLVRACVSMNINTLTKCNRSLCSKTINILNEIFLKTTHLSRGANSTSHIVFYTFNISQWNNDKRNKERQIATVTESSVACTEISRGEMGTISTVSAAQSSVNVWN